MDGKTFGTLTEKYEKPYDKNFSDNMIKTAKYLCSQIQGAKCAYTQSDEISILLTDFDKFNTQPWLDYEQSKVESISAGMTSSHFTLETRNDGTDIMIKVFDSKARNYPKEEVCNYFIGRQLDWFRNSLSMYTRSYYSHNQMRNKRQPDLHQMLHDKGVNWADLQPRWKNGTFIKKEEGVWVDSHPVFTLCRYIIEDLLIPSEG